MKSPRTWLSIVSNFAYVVGGFVAFMMGHLTALVMGFFEVMMGVLSAWFHWDYEWDHQAGDRAGMYLTFTSMLGVAIYITVGVALWEMMILTIAASIFMAIKAFDLRWGSKTVLPILILPQLLLVGISVGWMTTLMLVIWYLCSVVMRELPEANWWTPPRIFGRHYDLIHGLWHLNTAGAITVNMMILVEAAKLIT